MNLETMRRIVVSAWDVVAAWGFRPEPWMVVGGIVAIGGVIAAWRGVAWGKRNAHWAERTAVATERATAFTESAHEPGLSISSSMRAEPDRVGIRIWVTNKAPDQLLVEAVELTEPAGGALLLRERGNDRTGRMLRLDVRVSGAGTTYRPIGLRAGTTASPRPDDREFIDVTFLAQDGHAQPDMIGVRLHYRFAWEREPRPSRVLFERLPGTASPRPG